MPSRQSILYRGGYVLASIVLTWAAVRADVVGRRPFTDTRNPPYHQDLDVEERAQVDLGHAVFNTQWVPAGTANASRRDGLGPLFNAAACDACHNEGAHGRGPVGDGDAPAALVMELGTVPGAAEKGLRGDPRYGRTLNTSAIDGVEPEAVVKIRYRNLSGRYPDGESWMLRSPRYLVTGLKYGALSNHTLLQPRLAPAIFGTGLLESVPNIATGRFGWQGTELSIRDQTAQAFARDMGLTSSDVPKDDCTAPQQPCLAAANGGAPEVSDEFLAAVVAFQRYLAVPERGALPAGMSPKDGEFAALGCASCHRERLPVALPDPATRAPPEEIDAYTDLRLHDLGPALADRTVAGDRVTSRWRTAPLWGLAHRLRMEKAPTFLHDGRARSIEEAVLWHAGEAEDARRRFERLPRARRQELLLWLGTL